MKTKKELEQIKEEVKALNKKLAVLNEDELNMVTGGASGPGIYAFTDPDTGPSNNQKPIIVHRKCF